jgi:hypothetical protein
VGKDSAQEILEEEQSLGKTTLAELDPDDPSCSDSEMQ